MRFRNRDFSQSLQPRTKSAIRMIRNDFRRMVYWYTDESALHCVHFFEIINGSENLHRSRKMRPTLSERILNIFLIHISVPIVC